MRTIDRDIVGAFIFSKDDQILLGKGGVYPGKWIVPGGGIEPGETKLAALKREILEETGIDISGDKVEALKEVLEGESQKTLRDSGERVLVKMRFIFLVFGVCSLINKSLLNYPYANNNF